MDRTREVLQIIIDELEKDVVGPRRGINEILPERENPVTGYLSGVIFPRHTPIDSEDDEKNYTAISGDGDDSAADYVSANVGLKPSSFGLSCVVAHGTDRVLASVAYGCYFQSKQNGGEFHRSQFEEKFDIVLDTAHGTMPFKSNPNFLLKYSAKKRSGGTILNVFVVNNHIHKGRSPRSDTCIFQPTITLSAQNEADRIFLSRTDANFGSDGNHDSLLFDMLFRDKNNFAIGYGCAVEWNKTEIEHGAVSNMRTTFVPKYTVPNVRPHEIEADGLCMENLYRISEINEYRTLLRPIADEYERWITEELEPEMNSLPDLFRKTAGNQIQECRSALIRIKRGIEIVSSDATAGKAFAFTNRAMLLQQSYGKWARKNRENGKVEGTEPEEYFGKWRLFQLAFFLLNVESIQNPRSRDRGIADLLWFATGGGKTEAYMGIIAFTIAHRRLRNKNIDHLRYGTAVIMRYTLRLLTLQQFHRLTALMCGCEFIRRRNIAEWGDEPFLVGLWVGSSTTPNALKGKNGAEGAIHNARNGVMPSEHNPIQIVSCPWCGKKIGPYDYSISGRIEQCRIYCPNKACEFSKKPGAEDAGIPALVVDEDIYRRCPSLLIGTVDKFAQIAWKWETGSIFGMADKYCQKHGFVQNMLDKSCNTHRDAKSFLFENTTGPSRLEPPELIIQDELHLIAGPLGTLTGLYETAIDILCTNESGILPKIIASTATTRRSSGQMLNLFNRKISAVFPPQGINFGDSFFAKVAPAEDPGRTYIGICATAKSGLSVLGRISAAALRKTRSLQEGMHENRFSYADLDPYYTLVSYFNTIRELGGANKMYNDSVPGYIQRIFSNFEDGAADSYRNQPLAMKELTSRIKSGTIPEILKELDTVLSKTGEPVDLLLCTNMLSVGVDISRLGMMIINGQPKNHSEYIQASGRIGRSSPGLIITNYNYLKPRDLSHYENFVYYHSTFHKNVEPISITPFASRARDKALFGILVALVRLLEKKLAANNSADRFDKSRVDVSKALDTICCKIEERVSSVDSAEREGTVRDLKNLIDEWENFASTKKPLVYRKSGYEYAKVQENIYYLLGSVEDQSSDALKTVPNSLRDAESQAGLWYLPDTLSDARGGE